MKMTATEVYNKLLNDDKILTQQGLSRLNLVMLTSL